MDKNHRFNFMSTYNQDPTVKDRAKMRLYSRHNSYPRSTMLFLKLPIEGTQFLKDKAKTIAQESYCDAM